MSSVSAREVQLERQRALENYVARAEAVFRGIRWRGFGDATVTLWCESMEEQARDLLAGTALLYEEGHNEIDRTLDQETEPSKERAEGTAGTYV